MSSHHLQSLCLPVIVSSGTDGAASELYDPNFPEIDAAPMMMVIEPIEKAEMPPKQARFEHFVNLGEDVKFRSFKFDGRGHYISVDAFNAMFLDKNEKNPTLSNDEKRNNAASFRKVKLMPKASYSLRTKAFPSKKQGERIQYFIEVSKLRAVIRSNGKHYPSRFTSDPEFILKTETVHMACSPKPSSSAY